MALKSYSLNECERLLPQKLDTKTVYRLLPNNPDPAYYKERTDRNIGWITSEEQEMLAGMTVGIAGCGGMGGLLGQIFVRLGIGEVRIADCEEFDVSNINRQFGAMRGTVGHSKALVTAQKIHETSDDTTLVVYPQGITEETVEHFLDGCDVVCDEIEFWAVGARILLHTVARSKHVTLFNCDTVGHRTYIFRFTNDSMHVEEALGFTYEEGKILQEKVQKNIATKDDIKHIMEAVIRTFIPEVPEYFPDPKNGTVTVLFQRLFEEGKASIIATNPPMAGGFLANHILFFLLEHSGTRRNFVHVPKMPGYLSFDAALMHTEIVTKRWW